MKKSFFAALLLIALSFNIAKAQTDSLNNFDRNSIIRAGIAEGLHGEALRNFIAKEERRFLIENFKLNRTEVIRTQAPAQRITNCAGSDFESDQVALVTNSAQLVAWTTNDGYNTNIGSTSTSTMLPYFPGGLNGPTSCNLIGCCPLPPASSSVIISTAAAPYVDPQIGAQYPIYSVFGTNAVAGAAAANPQLSVNMSGEKFLRLGNGLTGDYGISRIYKTYTVMPSTSLLSYAFIFVTAPGHACCDASSLNFQVWNASTNSLLPGLGYSLSPASTQCNNLNVLPFYIAGTGAVYIPNSAASQIYNRWQINYIDLSPYIGQVITFEAIVTDCTAGGHYGKAYIDAQCSDLAILSSSTSVGQGQLCPGSVTLSASPQINSAIWLGPNNFSVAAATCAPPISGVYTLAVMNGTTATVSKTVQVQLSAFPTISPDTVCLMENTLLSVAGMQTYTWSTGLSNAPCNILVGAAQSTIGIVGTGTNGCNYSYTKNLIAVFDTVSILPKDTLICKWQSAILHAGAAQSYNWSNGATTYSTAVSPTINTTYYLNGAGIHGCSYSDSIAVYVQKCIGVEQAMGDSKRLIYLVVSPNPAHHLRGIEVRSEEVINAICITDLLGRQVYSQLVNTCKVQLSLVGISSGTYFIEVVTDSATKKEKLVIVE